MKKGLAYHPHSFRYMGRSSRRFGGFYIPNWLMGMALPALDKCVWAGLSEHVDQKGVACVRQSTLAVEIGVSTGSVQTGLKSLIEVGLIRLVAPIKGKRFGGGRINRYEFVWTGFEA